MDHASGFVADLHSPAPTTAVPIGGEADAPPRDDQPRPGIVGEQAGVIARHDLTQLPNYALLSQVPVRLSVELGSTAIPLADVLALTADKVVTLDRMADELLDIKVNGRLIARGEVVATNGRFGVRIVELVPAEPMAMLADRRM